MPREHQSLSDPDRTKNSAIEMSRQREAVDLKNAQQSSTHLVINMHALEKAFQCVYLKRIRTGSG